MTDDITVLDTLLNENDRRLELVKDASGRETQYLFAAEVAPDADDVDADWKQKKFPDEESARKWIDQIFKKRERARRQTYAFPVTVFVSGHWGSEGGFAEATLKGISATDSEWRVVVEPEKGTKTLGADRIYKRMPSDHAALASKLKLEINERERELYNITTKYELRLPDRSYGRMSVDEAIAADERMVALFEVRE